MSEYRLNYTAQEIDEKLGKIDSLAEKSEIPEVKQTTGNSTEDTMSQKAITNELLKMLQIETPKIVSSVDDMTDTTKHYVNQTTGYDLGIYET